MREPHLRSSNLNFFSPTIGVRFRPCFRGTLLVPQDRFVLRDRYDPPLSPYDYTSPLSGMRSYIKDHKKRRVADRS